MNHSQCVRKLIEVGKRLGFDAVGRIRGVRYKLANPDCVWYSKQIALPQVLQRIPKSEDCEHLPLLAFEVAYSEHEKALRGSLVSLQVASAAASVIVLLGKSADHRAYLQKLVEKYSFGRYAIWTEDDVNDLYNEVVGQ